jgi:alpha-1,6-mannosyltransferase
VSLGPRFSQVLSALLGQPQQILFLWNWKAAWLSLLLRGPIFLAATIRRGFLASLSVLLTEFFIGATTAGFYGALMQNLRNSTPVWLTAVFLVVVVPAFFQLFEFAIHTLRGTAHLRAAEIVSLGVGAVSSLFNWYAMRRGALLVGGEGGSFGSDLRRLPRLFFDFLATVPRKLAQDGKSAPGHIGLFPGRKLSPQNTRSMMLRTLHLTNSWHEASGGIATFYRALMRAANDRGHYMTLVVPGEGARVEKVGNYGKIVYLKARPAPLNSRYRIIYPGQFLAHGSALQSLLVSERPDLVEICDKYSLVYLGILLRLGLLRGLDFRPVVVGLTCERMDDNFRTYIGRLPLSRHFCAAYMKYIYFPFFDHHLANSPYTAEELRLASRGQLVRRSVWIRSMGVDTQYLSPARRSPRARRRILEIVNGRDDSVVLLYVGRLVPEKNLSLLFRLLVRLVRSGRGDYRLLVAGDGIERRRWEEFCGREVGLHATFLGHISNKRRLADLFANADIFIHPNPREPFGIAPLEAMASGVPLVAPDTGGLTSYADSANAWTVRPDVESFASAIEDVMASEDARLARVKNALRTAERNRWETVCPGFLDLYADLARAATDPTHALPSPAFSSTPACGLQRTWYQGVARGAERIFRVVSKTKWTKRGMPRLDAAIRD